MHEFDLRVFGVLADAVEDQAEKFGGQDLRKALGLLDGLFTFLTLGPLQRQVVLRLLRRYLLSNDVEKTEALGDRLVVIGPQKPLYNLKNLTFDYFVAKFEAHEFYEPDAET